jgi:hypothetical protein
MKRATAIVICFVFAAMAWTPAQAQEAGDYRTRASGNWNMAQNWQMFNGSVWGNINVPPTGTETITILEGDSIFVNVDVTITGRVVNQGRLAEDGLLTIGDGGVYQHDQDAGNLPQPTWEEGSTIHITGTTGEAPANRNQNYHHIILETPDLLPNVNMDLNDVTIGGDIHVLATGFARWYLTSATANESASITIMGDVIVEDGNFSVHGTGNVGTQFLVDHYGDIVVTGGNFSISRGSQPLGTTVWNLHSGNFSLDNATTQNSNATPGGARFVFMSGGEQQLTIGASATLTNLPIEVDNNTTLLAGQSVMSGGGSFEVQAGSTLATEVGGGISEMLSAVQGPVTLSTEAGYMFNGSEAQVTSSMMPETVAEIIIDNPAGVTLSQETTVTGAVVLRAGVFDNTIPFTLAAGAEVVMEGGSLLHGTSNEADAELPRAFFVDQNYPNPFNPSTTIRFGIPAHSDVSVKIYNTLGQQVMTLHEGRLAAGVHELTANFGNLSTGVYLYRVVTDFSDVTRQMVLIK